MRNSNKVNHMAKVSAPTTQSFLKISEIRADTLIMSDGVYCAILAVSSINFDLKNTEEQNALIAGYQSFLNSLDFDIQILMQSRKMDIHSYLQSMKTLMQQQTNELLRVQTAEYIEFVAKLIEDSSIMSKNFYVVVPYHPGISAGGEGGKTKKKGFLARLFGRGDVPQAEIARKLAVFQADREKLDERVNTVVGGLSALGLKTIPLNTAELTELAYNSYNLGAAPLIDASKLNDMEIKE